MEFTYLASPYSHKSALVRQWRYEIVCRVAGELMQRGEVIFCPIAHSHPIDPAFERGHKFWMHQDLTILHHASCLKVLRLDGWDKSRGIAEEIEFALKANKSVQFIDWVETYLHSPLQTIS